MANYQDFQDQIFQEISDLKLRKSVLELAAEERGLAWEEALALHKPGMDGRQFLAALDAARKQSSTS